MKKIGVLMCFFAAAAIQAEGDPGMGSYFLLDDFSGEQSAIGTDWKGFTDQVMGGASQMSVTRVPGDDGNISRMRGKVSLENSGGFIQVRLMLKSFLNPFDASEYEGLRVKVRGSGSGYYIFLRTNTMILPWKYLAAPVPVTEDWRVVDIPWSAFEPGDYGRVGRLKVHRLKSLAVVAYGKEFEASIDLDEIGLYK